ncbi:MAG: disulfide bond formation protein B [Neisseriales bacterium]|nr:MAG: disulfide bond formation protein B [Neisseriales bacterium]
MSFQQLRKLNLIALVGVSAILLTALYYQLFIDTLLPCALCNLQRIGFLLFGSGLLINIRSNNLKGGYLLCFISSILGSYVSLLHILVEIPPGMPQVGSTIFGIHMYGWAFVMFNLLTIYIVTARFLLDSSANYSIPKNKGYVNYLTGLFLAITITCLMSVFLETGLRPMGFGQYHYWVICKYQGQPDAECERPTITEIIDQYKQNLEKIHNRWQQK